MAAGTASRTSRMQAQIRAQLPAVSKDWEPGMPAGRGPREQGVRGQRPVRVDAPGPGLRHRGADEPAVLLAQDAVLSGVRVEPGYRDPATSPAALSPATLPAGWNPPP